MCSIITGRFLILATLVSFSAFAENDSFDVRDDAMLKAIVDSGHLVMIGEHHGTNEVPALFEELVETSLHAEQKTLVALELETALAAEIETLIQSGDRSAQRNLLSAKAWRSNHDGRRSEAMFRLLVTLSDLYKEFPEQLEVVPLLDSNAVATDGRKKGRVMAAILETAIAGFEPDQVITLTGNWHNRIGKNPSPSMADALQMMSPVSYAAKPGRGAAWMCHSPSECGPFRFPEDDGIDRVGLRLLEDSSESGFHGLILFPAFSASPPAAATE